MVIMNPINLVRVNIFTTIKFFTFFLLGNFYFQPLSIATTKICEIEFGKQIQSIKGRSVNPRLLGYSEKTFICELIGYEHDKAKKPLINKPIYSCCRD